MKALAIPFPRRNYRKAIPFAGKIRHIPVKRLFDILFSLMALALGLPLFGLLAAIVKLSSKGPVLFGHERIGRGGRVFPCYKFRTMYEDADDRLKVLLAQNMDLRREWEANFKLKKDPRITPIGKFLRKTSLDELPQFLNVIKGDLSVVGPRPVVELEVMKFLGPKASKILSIRPGLTCLWQVSGRSNTSYSRRIHLDEQYVDKRSLALDMKIIARTLPAMFGSKGAY